MHHCVTLFLVVIPAYVYAIMPDNPHPHPNPNIIQGDIYIPPEEKEWMEKEQSRQGANFKYKPHWRWPRDKGSNTSTIYYELKPGDYDDEEIDVIEKASEEWNRVLAGCVEWKPRREAKGKKLFHWMYISKDNGCWSTVGKNQATGPQKMSLGPSCVNGPRAQVTVLHEMEHATGMWHEHSRYDRDEYIRVFTNLTDYVANAFKLIWENYAILIGEYDYYSITHYIINPTGQGKAFEVLKKGIDEDKIGRGTNGVTFSDGDVKKLKTLYECE